jgi:uncharacterized membrane protein YhaH (DUF805 family)
MTLNFADDVIEIPLLGFVMIALLALPAVVSVIAIVRVVQRAGYSGWWVLIMFFPILNMLALWYFGFAPWPADTRLARAR